MLWRVIETSLIVYHQQHSGYYHVVNKRSAYPHISKWQASTACHLCVSTCTSYFYCSVGRGTTPDLGINEHLGGLKIERHGFEINYEQ